MNPDQEQPCPECHGRKNALAKDNVTLKDLAQGRSKQVRFRTILDPAYERHCQKPMDKMWTGPFFICAACLGSGKRSDWAARVLSGEFVP